MSSGTCQCLTSAGTKCTRPAEKGSDKCWQHKNNCRPVTGTMPSTQKPAPVSTQKPAPVSTQKPAPVSTQKPAPVSTQKPAPVSTRKPAPLTQKPPADITSLPPDVLRLVMKNLPAVEVLDKCLVSKQFNTAICENVAFWRDRANKLGIKYDKYTTLDKLLKDIIDKENKRRVINIYDLTLDEPERREFNFEQPPEFNAFELAEIGESADLSVILDYLSREFEEYLQSDLPADDRNRLVTSQEYKQRLKNLHLQEYDILDFNTPNYEGEYLHYYTIYRDPQGKLRAKHIEAEFSEDVDDTIIFLPAEFWPLLQDMYKRFHRPLSAKDLRKVYHKAYVGFTDPKTGTQYVFTEDAKPIRVNDIEVIAIKHISHGEAWEQMTKDPRLRIPRTISPERTPPSPVYKPPAKPPAPPRPAVKPIPKTIAPPLKPSAAPFKPSAAPFKPSAAPFKPSVKPSAAPFKPSVKPVKPPAKPVTTIDFSRLPPDVIRKILQEVPTAEILEVCKAHPPAKAAVCDNLAFWRERARIYDIPFTDTTSIQDLINSILTVKPFVWVKRHIATKMSDLTPTERAQWKAYLEHEDLSLDNWEDFFSPENDGDDGYNDDITVETWEWITPDMKRQVITDIYAWPGDNQAGAIFIGSDNTPSFIISDMNLEDSRRLPIDRQPHEQLELQRDNLDKLRHIIYADEDDVSEEGDWPIGSHCYAQWMKSQTDFKQNREVRHRASIEAEDLFNQGREQLQQQRAQEREDSDEEEED